jgi:hypothetical protein
MRPNPKQLVLLFLLAFVSSASIAAAVTAARWSPKSVAATTITTRTALCAAICPRPRCPIPTSANHSGVRLIDHNVHIIAHFEFAFGQLDSGCEFDNGG